MYNIFLKVDNRLKLIYKYIKNKSVLDFGPGGIEHRQIYKFVNTNSKSYSGIEINKKKCSLLSKKGINVYNLNAESFDLNKKFDTLFAGEFIEHLNNPGNFLLSCKKHMKKNSHLILTTPNAYSFNKVLRSIFSLGNVPQFHEHVLLFNEQLLVELLSRYKFKIVSINYFNYSDKGIKSKIINFFSKISPYFSESIMIVAK